MLNSMNISKWDVSNVKIFSNMFYNATLFNQELNGWNTINAIDMSFMFCKTLSFNQYIGNWNTANVVNMNGMFSESVFNNGDDFGVATKPLNWNTSKVIDMSNMFRYCTKFNQNISYNCVNDYWNTSSVINLEQMFQGTKHKINPFNNGKKPGVIIPMGWKFNSVPKHNNWRQNCALSLTNKPLQLS